MKISKLINIATYTSCGITVLLGLIYIIQGFILRIFLNISSDNSSSIAVIGGADGPTAIFLTTKSGGLSLEILILVFVVITTVLFLLKKAITKGT